MAKHLMKFSTQKKRSRERYFLGFCLDLDWLMFQFLDVLLSLQLSIKKREWEKTHRLQLLENKINYQSRLDELNW